MTPNNKKSKLPIVIVTVAILAISIGSGFAIGDSVLRKNGYLDKLANKFGITVSESEKPNKENSTNTDAKGLLQITPVPEIKDGGLETTDIYEKVNPSVVSINVYGNQAISPIGSGTGIIMTEDGYIITNAHVVEDGTSVNVVFEDGSNARGVIVGMDKITDLAVVKVEKKGLVAAEFGDSSQLKQGERVVAIGNAGGLSSTITQGIISGLDRDLGEGARSLRLIQVDAAINPGNSGGPLINRFGQVIGINSSKIADVNFEGIGFSIPISEAVPLIESIIENGYVAGRAVLGVSIVELNDSNGPRNGLPSKGVFIADIDQTSDLLNKGVRTRDVIIEANGEVISSADDLLAELDKYSPGDMFNLVIYRAETDQKFSVDVILMESVQ